MTISTPTQPAAKWSTVAAVAPRCLTKATVLLAEILRGPLRRHRPHQSTTIGLPDGEALLYQGGSSRSPGIVLVHGAAPGGPGDPRIVVLASALARLDRTVLAPELSLSQFRLDLKDPDRINNAITFLAEYSGGPVLVFAASYGAALSIVALERNAEVQANVVALVTLGTYYDLVHLVQGVTTGSVEGPDGYMVAWDPHPLAGLYLLSFLSTFLEGGSRQEVLDEAYRSRQPAELDAASRAIYDLLVNDDPGQTRRLAGELPSGLCRLVTELSPSSGIALLRVPVMALHSRHDPAAPATESDLLVQSLQPPAHGRCTLIGSFRHLTPRRSFGLIRDTPALMGFLTRVFLTQETRR